jgi:Domain of unknown function (DUF5979)
VSERTVRTGKDVSQGTDGPDGLVDALETGRLDRATFEAAAERVIALRAKFAPAVSVEVTKVVQGSPPIPATYDFAWECTGTGTANGTTSFTDDNGTGGTVTLGSAKVGPSATCTVTETGTAGASSNCSTPQQVNTTSASPGQLTCTNTFEAPPAPALPPPRPVPARPSLTG